MFRKIINRIVPMVVILIISEPVTVFSASVHNAYSLTLAILSYSKWPDNVTPTLCVIDNPTATQAFQNLVKRSAYDYQILGLNTNNFAKSQCHAVFFSNITPSQQQILINNYPKKNLLSFSNNNSECEIGSIFCLYYERGSMTFKVNLDALTHSQIHIDPRVLLLARNAE